MNKEEILEYLEESENIIYSNGNYLELDYLEQQTLNRYIKELQQENKQLKEQIIDYSYKLSHFASEETYEKEIKQLQGKIDEAIEYIEYCLEENCEDSCDYLDNRWLGKKLLEILKGGNNDNTNNN